jgi:hypothetical protein
MKYFEKECILPGKLMFQVGELLGQSFNNAGVDATDDAVIGSPQVL